jgi:hypothetical protein
LRIVASPTAPADHRARDVPAGQGR